MLIGVVDVSSDEGCGALGGCLCSSKRDRSSSFHREAGDVLEDEAVMARIVTAADCASVPTVQPAKLVPTTYY